MLHEIRKKPGKVGIMRAYGALETLFLLAGDPKQRALRH
jgi:hypothetical protein